MIGRRGSLPALLATQILAVIAVERDLPNRVIRTPEVDIRVVGEDWGVDVVRLNRRLVIVFKRILAVEIGAKNGLRGADEEHEIVGEEWGAKTTPAAEIGAGAAVKAYAPELVVGTVEIQIISLEKNPAIWSDGVSQLLCAAVVLGRSIYVVAIEGSLDIIDIVEADAGRIAICARGQRGQALTVAAALAKRAVGRDEINVIVEGDRPRGGLPATQLDGIVAVDVARSQRRIGALEIHLRIVPVAHLHPHSCLWKAHALRRASCLAPRRSDQLVTVRSRCEDYKDSDVAARLAAAPIGENAGRLSPRRVEEERGKQD